ncbi:hypothetical protein [Thiomicrorhabdus sp.]|uniref:hypothetical protein n=1 Tax=Thiomicrorhabdus sp. TaxID=2039724 RepID=UPI0029C7AF4E|nr:hypothetical protein [Thiomicrorhabdus sp.]
MNLLNNQVSSLLLSGLMVGIGFSLPAEAREDSRQYKIYVNGPINQPHHRNGKDQSQRHYKNTQNDKRHYTKNGHRPQYNRNVKPSQSYQFSQHDRRRIESYYYPKKGSAYGHRKSHSPHHYRYRLYEPLPAYIHYRPLPVRLEYGLPQPPRGYVRVSVDGDILLMHLATRIIYDVIRIASY